MQNILEAATPHLLELAALALMALISWAANKAWQKWGLDIEARHCDALHTALMTGARLAASRQLTATAAVDLILGYAKTSVPDALVKLNPPQSELENLAKAKLGEAIGRAIK